MLPVLIGIGIALGAGLISGCSNNDDKEDQSPAPEQPSTTYNPTKPASKACDDFKGLAAKKGDVCTEYSLGIENFPPKVKVCSQPKFPESDRKLVAGLIEKAAEFIGPFMKAIGRQYPYSDLNVYYRPECADDPTITDSSKAGMALGNEVTISPMLDKDCNLEARLSTSLATDISVALHELDHIFMRGLRDAKMIWREGHAVTMQGIYDAVSLIGSQVVFQSFSSPDAPIASLENVGLNEPVIYNDGEQSRTLTITQCKKQRGEDKHEYDMCTVKLDKSDGKFNVAGVYVDKYCGHSIHKEDFLCVDSSPNGKFNVKVYAGNAGIVRTRVPRSGMKQHTIDSYETVVVWEKDTNNLRESVPGNYIENACDLSAVSVQVNGSQEYRCASLVNVALKQWWIERHPADPNGIGFEQALAVRNNECDDDYICPAYNVHMPTLLELTAEQYNEFLQNADLDPSDEDKTKPYCIK